MERDLTHHAIHLKMLSEVYTAVSLTLEQQMRQIALAPLSAFDLGGLSLETPALK
jgi:hypothetical protein